MLSSIVNVTPMDNYKLKIVLDNGSVAIVNLTRKLITARFGILKTPSIWEAVTNNATSINWNNYVSITLSEALEIMTEH